MSRAIAPAENNKPTTGKHMKKIILMIACGLAMVAALWVTVPAAQAQAPERHPKIRAAIHALEDARAEMKGAAHDFGGHRVAALAACDEAIKQLQLALQYDKN